jgi:hypothetical protein
LENGRFLKKTKYSIENIEIIILSAIVNTLFVALAFPIIKEFIRMNKEEKDKN